MSDEKNKYITAYGSSNADSYGRGDVTDVSTKYNMLTTNPLSDENAPEMSSYSSDGSYNQDIFGCKCFNSPVSFRNGIYGECGAIVTSDEFYIYAGDGSEAPHIDTGADADTSTKSGINVFNYGNAKVLCGNASSSKYVVDEDRTYTFKSDSVCLMSFNDNCEASIHVTSTEIFDGESTGYSNEIIIKSDAIYLQTNDEECLSVCKSTVSTEQVNKINFIGNKRWVVGSSDKRLDKIYISDADITNISCDSYVAKGSKELYYSDTQLTQNSKDYFNYYYIKPCVSNVSLGDENNKFKYIYADELRDCVIPHISSLSPNTIPKGALCVFTYAISGDIAVERGRSIQYDSNTGQLKYHTSISDTQGTVITLYFCDLKGNIELNGGQPVVYPGATGVKLMVLTHGEPYSSGGLFLAIRIE